MNLSDIEKMMKKKEPKELRASVQSVVQFWQTSPSKVIVGEDKSNDTFDKETHRLKEKGEGFDFGRSDMGPVSDDDGSGSGSGSGSSKKDEGGSGGSGSSKATGFVHAPLPLIEPAFLSKKAQYLSYEGDYSDSSSHKPLREQKDKSVQKVCSSNSRGEGISVKRDEYVVIEIPEDNSHQITGSYQSNTQSAVNEVALRSGVLQQGDTSFTRGYQEDNQENLSVSRSLVLTCSVVDMAQRCAGTSDEQSSSIASPYQNTNFVGQSNHPSSTVVTYEQNSETSTDMSVTQNFTDLKFDSELSHISLPKVTKHEASNSHRYEDIKNNEITTYLPHALSQQSSELTTISESTGSSFEDDYSAKNAVPYVQSTSTSSSPRVMRPKPAPRLSLHKSYDGLPTPNGASSESTIEQASCSKIETSNSDNVWDYSSKYTPSSLNLSAESSEGRNQLYPSAHAPVENLERKSNVDSIIENTADQPTCSHKNWQQNTQPTFQLSGKSLPDGEHYPTTKHNERQLSAAFYASAYNGMADVVKCLMKNNMFMSVEQLKNTTRKYFLSAYEDVEETLSRMGTNVSSNEVLQKAEEIVGCSDEAMRKGISDAMTESCIVLDQSDSIKLLQTFICFVFEDLEKVVSGVIQNRNLVVPDIPKPSEDVCGFESSSISSVSGTDHRLNNVALERAKHAGNFPNASNVLDTISYTSTEASTLAEDEPITLQQGIRSPSNRFISTKVTKQQKPLVQEKEGLKRSIPKIPFVTNVSTYSDASTSAGIPLDVSDTSTELLEHKSHALMEQHRSTSSYISIDIEDS